LNVVVGDLSSSTRISRMVFLIEADDS